MKDNDPVDVVITWVDGDDPEWFELYRKYAPSMAKKKETSLQRFKSLDNLMYIFRGIENYMPWVRHIHLVTFGHYPAWLDLDSTKVRLVKHGEIFQSKESLPVFNSGTIEMNFDNIPGLAEKFIYFNDDMFVVGEVSKDFFFKNDLPCDFLKIVPLMHAQDFSHRLHEQMMLATSKETFSDWGVREKLSKIFNFRYGLKSLVLNALFLKLKHYPLFEIHHHPQPYLKSNLVDVKETYHDKVEYTINNKFRTKDTLSQYIFRFHALAKGEFYPQVPQGCYLINYSSFEELEGKLEQVKAKHANFVCFNDSHFLTEEDFSESKELMLDYFNNLLPHPSSFELKK